MPASRSGLAVSTSANTCRFPQVDGHDCRAALSVGCERPSLPISELQHSGCERRRSEHVPEMTLSAKRGKLGAGGNQRRLVVGWVDRSAGTFASQDQGRHVCDRQRRPVTPANRLKLSTNDTDPVAQTLPYRRNLHGDRQLVVGDSCESTRHVPNCIVDSALLNCQPNTGDLLRLDCLAVERRLVNHKRTHRDTAQSSLQRNDRPKGVSQDVGNSARFHDHGAQILDLAIKRVLRTISATASAAAVVDPHAVVLGQSQLDKRKRSDAVKRSMNEHQRVPLARLPDRQPPCHRPTRSSDFHPCHRVQAIAPTAVCWGPDETAAL